MADECEHEWVPGEFIKGGKLWELYVQEVRCKKCGFINPDLYAAPMETILRQRARKNYESDEAYEKHLMETAERYERLGIADVAI